MKTETIVALLCVCLAITFPIIGYLLDRVKALKSRVEDLEAAWPTSEYPLPTPKQRT